MVLSTIKRLPSVYFSPSLDNFVFKFCYKWTALLLVVFSFIVTVRLLLGDSFECLPVKDLTSHITNLKCYADGVYSSPLKNVQRAGIDLSFGKDSSKRYQTYYPWVNLFLLVHAFNFCIPRLVWKSYESGYMHRLTAGVQAYLVKEERRDLELCYIAKYVLVTQGKHKFYTLTYIFAEAGNYVVSLSQTVWLVWFFGVTGIPKSSPLKIKTWSDFKDFYFPSTGICEIRFPPTFDVIYTSCELPLNSLYGKMFVFLHAWYIVLTISCGLVLVYRIILLVPSFRALVAKSRSSLAEGTVLESLCHRMSYGDWFFLSRIQKSMADVDFAQLIDKIAILSQGKNNANKRVSFLDDGMRDSDNSSDTSPV